MKAVLDISKSFLLENGFQEKTSNETYYENVLNSSEPQVAIYVYCDNVSMQIGGSGRERVLKIKNETQLIDFMKHIHLLKDYL